MSIVFENQVVVENKSKKIPNVIKKIEKLMKYETAGDPVSNLKWMRKTTKKIADALDTIDIKVSKTTVGKILKNLGFSLKTNLHGIIHFTLTKYEKIIPNYFFSILSIDPDILIADEALAVGDEAFQRKCFARIKKIPERGRTILFVSHGTGAAIELCNRAVLLEKGELIASGSRQSK